MTKSPEREHGATLRLAPDEAIVLFELLMRWSDESGDGDTPSAACFESMAEPAALNNLLGQLERQLVAPFRSEYSRLLDSARSRLAQEWPYPTLRSNVR